MAQSQLTISSPIGPLTLTASAGMITAVTFGGSSSKAHADADVLIQAARELEEYFAGARREFTVPHVAPDTSTFAGQVQAKLVELPWGTVATYGELAAMCGRPTAARAAGTACATNPVPIIVPCHRVVRADGSPGNYLGGTAAKEFLISLESGNQTATIEV